MWNDTDREKPTYAERNLSECPFVHYKSHMTIWDGTRALAVRDRAQNELGNERRFHDSFIF